MPIFFKADNAVHWQAGFWGGITGKQRIICGSLGVQLNSGLTCRPITTPVALCWVATMLVVDSTVWIDCFKGVENLQTDCLDSVLETTPILVGDLMLAEVLQGFRREADFEKTRRVPGKYLQREP
jgi:hypothetical protein